MLQLLAYTLLQLLSAPQCAASSTGYLWNVNGCCVRYLHLCALQTHEEPLTDLVASEVHSHKQLPLRLYQVYFNAYTYCVYRIISRLVCNALKWMQTVDTCKGLCTYVHHQVFVSYSTVQYSLQYIHHTWCTFNCLQLDSWEWLAYSDICMLCHYTSY